MSEAGPVVPFPLVLSDGRQTGITAQPAKGTYSAEEIAGIVTVRAGGIAMSGLNVSVALVHDNTYAPPEQFELIGFASMRSLDNLLILSAPPASFKASADTNKFVNIVDSDGIHAVQVLHL